MKITNGNVDVTLEFTLWRVIVQERLKRALEQVVRDTTDDSDVFVLSPVYVGHAGHITEITGVVWKPLTDGVGTPAQIADNYNQWLRAVDTKLMSAITEAINSYQETGDLVTGPQSLSESIAPEKKDAEKVGSKE